MIEVTKEEFFARVGPMDVNPRVDVPTLKGRHHTSWWETPQRVLVGKSTADGWGIDPTQFWLSEGGAS
jgi:hypothetical protein